MSSEAPTPSWHAAFPTPVSKPEVLTVEEVHQLVVSASTSAPAQHLIVDVRRTDFEDAFILGAINLPAQSFHQTLPSLLPILSQYPLVIFHCVSSNGRGPRVAAWYQDALDERGIVTSRAAVLGGGIKAWVATYGDGPSCCKL